MDDLAFDMYQDPEVACIIRQLDQKKQDMVHQERFEQAKYLKQAIADLQKVSVDAIVCLEKCGTKLSKYVKFKRVIVVEI